MNHQTSTKSTNIDHKLLLAVTILRKAAFRCVYKRQHCSDNGVLTRTTICESVGTPLSGASQAEDGARQAAPSIGNEGNYSDVNPTFSASPLLLLLQVGIRHSRGCRSHRRRHSENENTASYCACASVTSKTSNVFFRTRKMAVLCR